MTNMTHWLSVVVQTPAHSSVAGLLTYRSEVALQMGAIGYALKPTTREQLNSVVEIVPAGIVEIMERQQDGYAYVRP